MNNDEQYTPSDEQMEADWHAYITTPDPENYYYDALSSEEADARWSRWMAAHDARVRRDAALALAEHFSAEAIDQARQGNLDGADFNRAVAAEIEKQTPEETP